MHYIKQIINKRNQGENIGIASYCTANELVLEAAIIRAKYNNKPVLIEATANQVNQFGGYTNMKAVDYKNFVYSIADKYNLDKDMIILGGDHLGPLTWKNLNTNEAMHNAKKLVFDYVLAGYTKIHLDTSMRLKDDPDILSTEVIAKRGAELYIECMKAYSKLKEIDNNAQKPVFVIGSEVPIPGGATDIEDTLSVTKVEDFERSIISYKNVFSKLGITSWEDDVVAFVVQPGVEFGDSQVFYYNTDDAKDLCCCLKKYPNIVFEGHSTDYQTSTCLKNMVEDGIAILKVGPALTFGLREALFQLANMEKELVPLKIQSNFIEILDRVMIENPHYWESHYHGNNKDMQLARKYSYSDRSRYYMNNIDIQKSINILFDNLRKYKIPLSMLHQFMPIQYNKVISNSSTLDPKDLALQGIYQYMEDYENAV